MDEPPELSDGQRSALADLGVPRDRLAAFSSGEAIVVFNKNDSLVTILRWTGERLRCGIASIRDPGRGHLTLLRFRNRCHKLAIEFRAVELELFGAAVINQELSHMLLRQGYETRIDDVPDELGGGQEAILSRVFPLKGDPDQ